MECKSCNREINEDEFLIIKITRAPSNLHGKIIDNQFHPQHYGMRDCPYEIEEKIIVKCPYCNKIIYNTPYQSPFGEDEIIELNIK